LHSSGNWELGTENGNGLGSGEWEWDLRVVVIYCQRQRGKGGPQRVKKNKRDDPLGSLAVLYFEVFTYEMC